MKIDPRGMGRGKVVRGKLKRKMSLRLIEQQFSLNCWAIQTIKLRHERSRCYRGKMSWREEKCYDKKRMETFQCNFVSDLASSLPGQFELETEKVPGNCCVSFDSLTYYIEKLVVLMWYL